MRFVGRPSMLSSWRYREFTFHSQGGKPHLDASTEFMRDAAADQARAKAVPIRLRDGWAVPFTPGHRQKPAADAVN